MTVRPSFAACGRLVRTSYFEQLEDISCGSVRQQKKTVRLAVFTSQPIAQEDFQSQQHNKDVTGRKMQTILGTACRCL